MIKVEEYLEAKKIVEQYEEQLNIPLVIWRCTKNLYMKGTKDRVFTKGKEYKQTMRGCLITNDDTGTKHSFGEWEKYFTSI
jgi:hypothetical protein